MSLAPKESGSNDFIDHKKRTNINTSSNNTTTTALVQQQQQEPVVPVPDKPLPSKTQRLLERTIQFMEGSGMENNNNNNNKEDDDDGICAHPQHLHSFQQVNFLLSLRQSCAGCHARLQSVVAVLGAVTSRQRQNNENQQVVRCLACGVYAHRRCAMNAQLAQTLWKEPCPVNQEKLQPIICAAESSNNQTHKQSQSQSDNEQDGVVVVAVKESDPQEPRTESQACKIDAPDCETSLPSSRIKMQQQPQEENEEDLMRNDSESTLEWTTEGPPEHWAAIDKPPNSHTSATTITPHSNLPSSSIADRSSSLLDQAVADDADEDDEGAVHIHNAPLHYASHPFASVSRALQENILAHFRNHDRRQRDNNHDNDDKNEAIDPELTEPLIPHEATEATNETIASSSVDSDQQQQQQQNNPVVQFVSGTVNAVRTTVSIPTSRLGAAAVAGGIAGGMAGLAIAGPAGAIAGWGSGAGALGVLLEGSVSVGVFVAGVATGSAAGKHIHEHLEERRVLEMGERGASRKVLLVRPNIKIDASWESICAQAAASAPQRNNNRLFASRDRQRRGDDDIVQQTEEEIPTNDKLFLLVSRILNDKDSLPGHVYRCLIDKFFERYHNRKELNDEGYTDSEASGRSCRDDTHAIIKFVTATLLEVRPGLDASPTITELTATAVESLVFGKVYDEVIQEIEEEVSEKDAALLQKIEQCQNDPKIHEIVSGDISEKALRALQRLPTAHTAVNKLEDCVEFLESISAHFASSAGSNESLCADSLLKMVCQHILMAKVDRLNAEITFLEEFARDEQLLRGREGYSLVTLQAALHFLNMCDNIETDIFGQDDDEANLPLTSSSDLDESVEIVPKNA